MITNKKTKQGLDSTKARLELLKKNPYRFNAVYKRNKNGSLRKGAKRRVLEIYSSGKSRVSERSIPAIDKEKSNWVLHPELRAMGYKYEDFLDKHPGKFIYKKHHKLLNSPNNK